MLNFKNVKILPCRYRSVLHDQENLCDFLQFGILRDTFEENTLWSSYQITKAQVPEINLESGFVALEHWIFICKRTDGCRDFQFKTRSDDSGVATLRLRNVKYEYPATKTLSLNLFLHKNENQTGVFCFGEDFKT